jgi:maleate cis-trans isomerase
MMGEEGGSATNARTTASPVVATCTAIVVGLRALGAHRVALVDPPWFDASLNELGRRYYESAGFDVVRAARCALPSNQASITAAGLYGWVTEQGSAGADALVIGGTRARASLRNRDGQPGIPRVRSCNRSSMAASPSAPIT